MADTEAGVTVEVMIEPTGPAWLLVVVFFAATGDVVYRVSSQKAADLRRYVRRHHKTNRIEPPPWPASPSWRATRWFPSSSHEGVAAELDRQVRVPSG